MAKVLLLANTPNPDHLVAVAARQCYSAGFVGDTYGEVNPAADEKLLDKIFDMGHLSVIEHATFTLAFGGMSRACSHQLVRFRVASFSQQSQRYCFLGEDFDYGIPPTIHQYADLTVEYDEHMEAVGKFYAKLVDAGIPAEDARFVLPNATDTNIIMTMNARELHHFFDLRCCSHAQWEIRDLANQTLALVREAAPLLFKKAGPSCVTRGVCSEGARCCGRINSL